VENPSDEEGVSSFEDNLNPDSLVVMDGFVEKALGDCEVGAKYQFMRNGYFCKDKDVVDNMPVFNRTVALRDGFKIQK
jgi:glutaminyl-tRNA synthetase